MDLIRKPLLFFALVFALIPLSGSAQYVYEVDPFFSNFKNPQRYDIGGGIVLPSGEFTGVVTVNNSSGGYVGDTTATRAIKGSGFGATIGLNLPFKGTGHISRWAATVAINVNLYTWDDLNQTYGTDGTYKSAPKALTANTTQITIPLGVDWKIGNDAILSKRLAFGASFGAGFIPHLTMSSVDATPATGAFNTQYEVGCRPFVKFDWSIFAGWCWKIRVMYAMGNANILDINRKIPGVNDGPFTIRQNSSLMVSLLVMPFSVKWRESAWYNTYDTYNQHDRFN